MRASVCPKTPASESMVEKQKLPEKENLFFLLVKIFYFSYLPYGNFFHKISFSLQFSQNVTET